jgi:uncharacterized membrane protein
MRYTGPAKPIPTQSIHPIDNRFSKGLFLIFLIATLAYDLLIGRPG